MSQNVRGLPEEKGADICRHILCTNQYGFSAFSAFSGVQAAQKLGKIRLKKYCAPQCELLSGFSCTINCILLKQNASSRPLMACE
jgi:hypothetical protein